MYAKLRCAILHIKSLVNALLLRVSNSIVEFFDTLADNSDLLLCFPLLTQYTSLY